MTQRLDPKLVDLTFDDLTRPACGCTSRACQLTGPTTVTSWDNWTFPVNASDADRHVGQRWELDSWSDGGAAATYDHHPASPATYTAAFRHAATYVRPLGATPLRASLVPAYAECTAAERGARPAARVWLRALRPSRPPPS